jgi:hypothetical protein
MLYTLLQRSVSFPGRLAMSDSTIYTAAHHIYLAPHFLQSTSTHNKNSFVELHMPDDGEKLSVKAYRTSPPAQSIETCATRVTVESMARVGSSVVVRLPESCRALNSSFAARTIFRRTMMNYRNVCLTIIVQFVRVLSCIGSEFCCRDKTRENDRRYPFQRSQGTAIILLQVVICQR